MNFTEIVSKLTEFGINPEMLATGDWQYSDNSKKIRANLETLGVIKEVDQKGGEGQGEEWYSVTHFVDHDVYIHIDAFYMSYDGTDFSGSEFKEVRPITKTVTVYE